MIITKTLSELAVGDVIVDMQGTRHTIVEAPSPIEADGSEFYPEITGMVRGFVMEVEHGYEGHIFMESRSIFPKFGDPESISFAIEVDE